MYKIKTKVASVLYPHPKEAKLESKAGNKFGNNL